ncbi:hypothetical protein Q7P36_010704 [Cladosporium allicinum]
MNTTLPDPNALAAAVNLTTTTLCTLSPHTRGQGRGNVVRGLDDCQHCHARGGFGGRVGSCGERGWAWEGVVGGWFESPYDAAKDNGGWRRRLAGLATGAFGGVFVAMPAFVIMLTAEEEPGGGLGRWSLYYLDTRSMEFDADDDDDDDDDAGVVVGSVFRPSDLK